MSHSTVMVGEEKRASKRGWRRCLESVGDWLAFKDIGEWFKDMKASVSMTASIIATMTFQLATNPPGGVVQVGPDDDVRNCQMVVDEVKREKYEVCPGVAVLGISSTRNTDYKIFLMSNTICFVASLSLCLLLVSGVSLNNRFVIWFMSILMCFTLTALTFTYLMATSLVTPNSIWDSGDTVTVNMYTLVLYIWMASVSLVVLSLIIRLLVRGVYKWIQKSNRARH